MEKLFKQLGESVTRWKASQKFDEFFVARVRLTFYYSLTAIIILSGASFALYNTILNNLSQSISEEVIDDHLYRIIMHRAQDILFQRFLTIDLVIVFFIVILGFLLTQKTLKPIKTNMDRQKRFIADASHELRTPTAVIISGLEVTLRNKNLDFPLAKKTLEKTLDEMREFSKLSNNLLDISKYDTQIKMEYENININELLNEIIEKNKNLAQAKEINVNTKINFEATVKGDKIELARVFYNIFDNAIKYTPQNGEIKISDKISANKYIVIVYNSGSGISKEIINKIFDPFFRGDAARNTAGAGLGLTMAKKIIENHKGAIAVKSLENKGEKSGTAVTITLPMSANSPS